MPKRSKTGLGIAVMGLLLLLSARDAHAYIDPGSGSLILQGVIAGVLAAGVALKAYWGKLRSLFGKKEAPQEQAVEEADARASEGARGSES